MRKLLKAKIHRATVTRAELDYEGSIAIDPRLIEAAGLLPFEAVQLWNVSNGERLETYAIPSDGPAGDICINGAAAHRFQPGDLVIIAAFSWLSEKELATHEPSIILVDEKNRVRERILAPINGNR